MGNPLIEALPPILNRAEASRFLYRGIEFNPEQREWNSSLRAHLVMQLLTLVQPLQWHIDLCERLSQLLMASYVLRSPLDRSYTSSTINGVKAIEIRSRLYAGSGSAPAMAIIGPSGIGKSTAVSTILSYYPQAIVHREHRGGSLFGAKSLI